MTSPLTIPPGLVDTEPDRSALKVLRDTHWTRKGWRRIEDRRLPPDFEHAKQAGLMFDPLPLSHDETVAWAVDVRSRVAPALVATSFIDSLASRRLDLRSALGSYSALSHLTPHTFDPWPPMCRVCNWIGRGDHDLSVLNFERFKFGGVRHDSSLFAALDLELLLAWTSAEEPADLTVFDAMTAAWEKLPDDATPTSAADALKGVLPGNKQERQNLVGLAALAGLLVTPLPLLTETFVSFETRDAAHPGGRNDWSYPAFAWRGEYGVNRDAVIGMLG